MTNYFDVKSIEELLQRYINEVESPTPKLPVLQMGYFALIRYREKQLWNMANRQ